ncbi:MAG TPA: nicotinate-nucleotide--dimethylbenzimidazole phosphoribosyltransferase [Lachnospiraceae bacterium]|nr:nicotinate-nucleotide--dimethylbenzimidazole phosphoribosyltransferase [Lachnospiraceae bacterium]
MDSLTWMEETIRQIHPPQDVFRRSCQARWDSLCKPIHGLGALEDMVSQIGAIQQTEQPDISRAVVVIMGADNGVVAEGVSQCGSEVTAQVLRNMAEGDSTVCQMARFRRTEVVAVDIGLNEPVNSPGVLNRAVRRGSGDIRTGPAMDRQEALQAIGEGIRIVHELKAQGCQILIPGEMGIGNTTTSAACVCAFFGKEPEKIAGPGAGLTKEGVRHKAEVIRDALRVNRPDRGDVLDVLSKVGGLDIAGMTGLFLGSAAEGIPTVIDGLIAALSAYIAVRLAGPVREYLIPGHLGTEPGDRILMEALQLTPPLRLGMHLGEGSGAALLLPLLDEALYIYRNLPHFGKCGIHAYKPLS